jgi:U3 small nucleolar RNA-associated protein 13
LKKDYKNAIILAMELDQPFRLLKLFEEVRKNRVDLESATGLNSVDDFLKSLDNDRVCLCIHTISDSLSGTNSMSPDKY